MEAGSDATSPGQMLLSPIAVLRATPCGQTSMGWRGHRTPTVHSAGLPSLVGTGTHWEVSLFPPGRAESRIRGISARSSPVTAVRASLVNACKSLALTQWTQEQTVPSDGLQRALGLPAPRASL